MVGQPTHTTTLGPFPRIRLSKVAWIVIASALGLAAAPFLLGAIALTAAGYVLPISDSGTRSDAIVVLGGFGVPRAEIAAQLYAARLAPLAIASGFGDCETMEQTLVANGVPPDAIETECASRSTFENAEATVRILRRRELKSATLVTHWFHTRRSIATFRAAAPEIRFSAVSVEPPATPAWRLGWSSEPTAVLAEYVKIVWYAVVHGVFIRVTPERNMGIGA